MKKTVKIAVSGVKNSGKTTLIEKLIPALKRRGIRTAVIKHDGHDFDADVPDTDSYRIRKAGAYGTAVFSASKFLLVKEETDLNPVDDPEEKADMLALQFPEADLILLEGFKNSSYPKLEVIRKGNSEKSVCEGKNLLAVVSDFVPDCSGEVPLFGLEDADGIAAFLEEQMHQEKEPHDPEEKFVHRSSGSQASDENSLHREQDSFPEISMVILAGGKSSRMGRDKSDLLLGEKTFLEIQIEKGRMLGITDILVSGYRGERCSVPVVRDRLTEKGPLGGLEACFRQVRNPYVLVLSVDVPLVPVEELKHLILQAEQDHMPVILHHGDRDEPMMGVYPADMADAMVQEITEGRGKVFRVLEKRGYEVYDTEQPDELFRNVNDPEAYRHLLEEAGV